MSFQNNLGQTTDIGDSRNHISDISSNDAFNLFEVFVGLTSLTYLSLRDNQLGSLPSRLLDDLSNLTTLDIGLNMLTGLHQDSLKSLKNLKVLILDSNQLRSVPQLALSHTKHLLTLDLRLNRLLSLESSVFSPVPGLHVLNLSQCSIRNISSTAFSNLSSLRTLDLSWNHLPSVPTSELHDLTQLRQLDLSGNQVRVLLPHALRTLQLLRQLRVSRSPQLRQIQAAAFHNNLDLQEVMLHDNPALHDIQPHAFPSILNLRRLSLSGSGLSSLHREAVSWERVTQLDLRGCPLRCGCECAWLAALKATGAKCKSPSRLAGRLVSELSGPELGCSTVARQQMVVVAAVICLGVVGLAVVVAVSCCTCRHHLRHLAATCTVSARENDYKSSYDNCIYLQKNAVTGPPEPPTDGIYGPCQFPYNSSYQHLDADLKEEDHGPLKPLCIRATQL